MLRRAGPGDEHRLALLGAATFLAAFAHDHPGDALVAHVANTHSPVWYARALADPEQAVFLVETDLKAPIGYAMLTLPEMNHPTTAADLELRRIYVLGDWKGGGWGVRLLRSIEEEARARGATRLLLCVYTANHKAQRFYAREGYADTGSRQEFMVGDVGFEDQIWAKAL